VGSGSELQVEFGSLLISFPNFQEVNMCFLVLLDPLACDLIQKDLF